MLMLIKYMVLLAMVLGYVLTGFAGTATIIHFTYGYIAAAQNAAIVAILAGAYSLACAIWLTSHPVKHWRF